MKVFEAIRDRVIGGIAGLTIGGSAIQLRIEDAEARVMEARMRSEAGFAPRDKGMEQVVKESIADLELALEDKDWRVMGGGGVWNFSRRAITRMMALSRLMYLVNPLIKRAVTVQELYVWGPGHTIKADNPEVQEVLDDFYKDPKNQVVVGNSWTDRERDQRIDGNQFFVFFVNRLNGAARVRLLPTDQVDDIVCNPNDSKEPWFYKRQLGSDTEDGTSGGYVLYPDIDYYPNRLERPPSYDGIPIKWDARVLHVKTGGLASMKFGLPELYSAFGWATAYKKILENFATILQAYARVAMTISNVAGKKGVAGAKSKMKTGVDGNGNTRDNNPPTNTASWMALSGGAEVKAVKTAHSTTGPDEARALRSMVAAGSDTPEHFFGDADLGNLATSKTLDRPTELKMVHRQALWTAVIERMSRKLIEWSAQAPRGKLRAAKYVFRVENDPFDGTTIFTVTPPEGMTKTVTVTFPSILEKDVIDRVRSVVQAVTLNGSKVEGIIPNRKYIAKMLLIALGEKNVDEIVDKMYPAEVIQGFIDPAAELDIAQEEADAKKTTADAAMIKAKALAKKPTAAPTAALAGDT